MLCEGTLHGPPCSTAPPLSLQLSGMGGKEGTFWKDSKFKDRSLSHSGWRREREKEKRGGRN